MILPSLFARPPGMLTLGIAILLKACPVSEGPDRDEPAELEAEEEVLAAEPTPEPLPPGLDAADLAPLLADDPRHAAASALREALDALDADNLGAALGALDRSRAAGAFAPALEAWTRGRVLRNLDRPGEADAAFAEIPEASRWWAEAALERAAIALESGDPAACLIRLGDEGAPGGVEAAGSVATRAEVLRARALRQRSGEGDEAAAYVACKRVWITEPDDTEAFAAAEAGMQALKTRVPEALHPSLEDKVARTASLARTHGNDAIVALLDREQPALRQASAEVGCNGHLQLGRAWHKKRKYGQSIPLLGWASANCADPEVAVKAAYLHAQSLSRGGSRTDAIAAYQDLADRFPTHRYADDGLYHAGELALEAGRTDQARDLFRAMATRFPEGDMVDKGLWGMAWAALSDGRPDDAMPWLEAMADGDPGTAARKRVLKGRYWMARTRLDRSAEREQALSELDSLARVAPMDWYGLLALWRLEQEDPAKALAASEAIEATRAALEASPTTRSRWPADTAFLEHPSTQAAIELLRGGFGPEAAQELALGPDAQTRWDRDTLLLASHLLAQAEDHYRSHNLLRMAFRKAFPPLEPAQRTALVHAYPLAFGDEVADVVSPFGWDPLLFQGLVREESAFAPAIKSWAGAMGLSQLMWPTAKETARKMGIKGLTRAKLSDPRLNLSIGSTYMNGLLRRWKGHLPLAVASYNAGPGAVRKWVDKRGHLELDAWVETIPYDQTRHYVKRVLSSHQTYRLLHGGGGAVPLRVGPVRPAIDAGDPSF